MLEEERLAARLDQLACFVFLGYAQMFRGEEITKIELSGVRKYFADGVVEPRHVTLSLIGRFKKMRGVSALPSHSGGYWVWD
jgi:hypothetical protein